MRAPFQQFHTYAARPTDQRILDIIALYLPGGETIVDVGSGAGIYGKALGLKYNQVLGYDYDKKLCALAEQTENFTHVFCDDVINISSHISKTDAVFCSEFLEHIPNKQLRLVINTLESICQDIIVITMPNPLSPHFNEDPTHICKYSAHSMYKTLQESTLFAYSMYPIGFSEYNLKNIFFRILQPIAKSAPALSPTILYIGKRKNNIPK
jgi:2-polyprenyl-3-methyl-5-hydroxy-6-metoxy-1,4-benzoquinol methylase